MATTLLSLKTYYDNVMRSDFAHIPAIHQTLLLNLSVEVDAGRQTLSGAQQQIVGLAIDTTSVASLAYSFFTGGTPSAGGFNYLVSAGGANANNLNSAYYQSFNTDNRYINFAVNLGKGGEGAAGFAAAYGGLTMTQAVTKAYVEIFGTTPGAEKVQALLNDQVPNGLGGTYTRAEYFASYGGDGASGVGTKAAMVGWLLAASAKENIGTYAWANAMFLTDLSDDGIAAFRSGLVTAYGMRQPGSTGVLLTVAADKSISPTATDAAQKSTANNDIITGTAGLNAGVSIDAGAGRDSIALTGTIYGTITTADGSDVLILGPLGATTATLGVPAQYASVSLGADGNVVTLKGGMAKGTSLTAAGTINTLIIDSGDAPLEGAISGFQTVYVRSGGLPSVTGAATIYSQAGGTFSIDNTQTLILKDTANPLVVYAPADPQNGARVDIHLQNFKGAPTTDAYVGRGVFVPNGGAIGLYTTTDGPLDTKGTLILHVDTDSTAGLIYGYATNRALGPNYRGELPNLTIVGAGSLTAQISGTFTNVDATMAGDLNLFYSMSASTVAQTLRLGDGTNKLAIYFGGSTSASLTPAAQKLYLGAGVDTINLGPGEFSTATDTKLANLHVKDGLTLSAPPEIIGFHKGVDHIVLDGQIHGLTANVQQYADGKATLQDALVAVSAHVAINTGAVFSWNGDTYVYSQDGTVGVTKNTLEAGGGDGLIKLVGVTGLTVGTGAGSYDIHYG